MVVLHASFAELSNRTQEILPAFGGIHLLATTFVHTGDVANISDRGTNFAAEASINPAASVAQAWIYGHASNGSAGQSSCKNYAGTVTYGGGHGTNGCGGQKVTAAGATAAEASAHLAESWSDLMNDTKDGKGNSYWASYWACNYDCNAWPFAL
jgi:hypothetical protein